MRKADIVDGECSGVTEGQSAELREANASPVPTSVRTRAGLVVELEPDELP